MQSFLYKSTIGSLLILFILSTNAWPQGSRRIGLNLGVSSWFSNCDIPAGGQNSATHPSYGFFLSTTYGRFVLSGTVFNGTFDIHPNDGIVRVTPDNVQFADPEAARRGFTSNGQTERLDADFNIRYVFNRYAQIALGLVINRHTGNVKSYWNPVPETDTTSIQLPSDPSRVSTMSYTDTQFWLSESFHGSAPIETISSRFAVFYNAAILFILGETGKSEATNPGGSEGWKYATGRITYTEENGEIKFHPRTLPNRTFGSNVGFAFSAGVSFQIINSPPLVAFGGYNYKFFSEKETDLIDHSVFQGPYLGLFLNVL